MQASEIYHYLALPCSDKCFRQLWLEQNKNAVNEQINGIKILFAICVYLRKIE